VVVVGGSVGGGDSGATEAGSASALAEPGRVRSAPGREAASPPDSMVTDTALSAPGSACDTATAIATMATLHSATTSARGDGRRIQRRCTDLTSSPPVRGRGRQLRPTPAGEAPSSEPCPGWWRPPARINRGPRGIFSPVGIRRVGRPAAGPADGRGVRRPRSSDRPGGSSGHGARRRPAHRERGGGEDDHGRPHGATRPSFNSLARRDGRSSRRASRPSWRCCARPWRSSGPVARRSRRSSGRGP